MTGMNVIFDPPSKDSVDNPDGRVGFAKSTCKYEGNDKLQFSH